MFMNNLNGNLSSCPESLGKFGTDKLCVCHGMLKLDATIETGAGVGSK